MPKVKRPRVRSAATDIDDEDDARGEPQRRGHMPYSLAWFREKFATYAFGTVVCGAAMVALAAWMGGSLGMFGKRMDAGVDVIMRSAGLSVDRVEIVPALDPLLERKVREAARIELGESMFAADPHAIRKRIETVEAVGRVSVFRLWPDQITISADPREPVALWESDGDWRVIDQRGRSFAQVAPADHLHLPRIAGRQGAEAASGLLVALEEYPDLAGQFASARRIGERRWDVTFSNGVELALPEDARLPEALAAVNLMHARSRLLDLPVSRIDARHPDRLALQPLPGAPAPVLGGA